ncbi:hypothetical protein [Croceicoccus mobilis]|uniref:Uncharacterized protein n=1 Tax=Croceicoccus mobilis TaxID=1703339 RepID=A0A916Z210_9SPHN|nr:hypothetical protein [Croceicoccus mobilis]GGD72260.1 hypothetical protein GCM10010990_22200 [Croceicoccus mobilis]
MEEVLTLAIVFGFTGYVIDQLRRVIVRLLLHRIIGRAMERAPDQVPNLIARMECQAAGPVSGLGLAITAFGLIALVALGFNDNANAEDFGIGLSVLAGGLAMVVARWINWRLSLRRESRLAAQVQATN